MAKHVRVDKNASVPEEPTEDGLAEALAEATAEVDTIATERHLIRAETPKGQIVEALTATDDAYIAALAAQAAADKAYGRFTRGGTGPGQKVKVGTAKEGEG